MKKKKPNLAFRRTKACHPQNPDKTRRRLHLQHHAVTYIRSSLQQKDVLLPKSETIELRRLRSGHHPALRRWKSLINRSEATMCRLCDNEEESYDHLWLRCQAFDADCQRLDLGASLDALVCLPAKA